MKRFRLFSFAFLLEVVSGWRSFPSNHDRHEIRCESPAWSRVTSVTSASRDERRPRPQRLRGARAGAEPRSPRSLPTSRLASPPAPAPPRLPRRGAGGSGGEPGSARLCSPCPGDSGDEAKKKQAALPRPVLRCCRRGRRAGLREGSGGDGRCRRRERARASTAAPLGQVRGVAGTSGGRGQDGGGVVREPQDKTLSATAGGRTGESSAVTQSESTARGREGGAKQFRTNEKQEKAGKAELVLAAGGAGARGGV